HNSIRIIRLYRTDQLAKSRCELASCHLAGGTRRVGKWSVSFDEGGAGSARPGQAALQVSKPLRPITPKPVVAIVPDRARLWTDSVHQGRPHGPRKLGKTGRLHSVWADAGGRA